MTQLTTINNPSQPSTQAGSDLFGRFSNLSSRLTDRVKDAGVTLPGGLNLDSLSGALKNLIPVNRDLTITKIVESVMDPQTASSSALAKTEGYMFFDPRSANARGTMPTPSAVRAGTGNTPGGLPGTQGPGMGASFGQRRQGYSDAILFMVGGGSMDEYGNLQEWIARTGGDRAKKRAIYGATEIMNATEFVQGPLDRLGQEVGS
jgi:sec1 family domain-containing protein 1